MTDQEMNLLQKVASIRGDPSPIGFLDLIRAECELPGLRRQALRAEVDTHRLARLISRRDRDDQERPALDQEIADLEAKLP